MEQANKLSHTELPSLHPMIKANRISESNGERWDIRFFFYPSLNKNNSLDYNSRGFWPGHAIPLSGNHHLTHCDLHLRVPIMLRRYISRFEKDTVFINEC